jgi:hypothetical protein
MVDESKTNRKYFTAERANAMLPLVRAIVKDLAELSRDVVDRRDRLAHLLAGRNGQSTDVYSEELMQIEEELEKDGRRLRDYVEELTKLGLEPKNGQEGLVDFPTLIDGREAYLCWKLDEPEVLYWHEMDAGFAGRQPLTVGAGVDASNTNSGGGSSGPQGH